MIRTSIFALALASSIPSIAAADKPAPTKPGVADGFPLPKDAGPPKDAPGGNGKILFFEIPRERHVVVAEVKAALESAGWTIHKNSDSPSGRAIRLEVRHDGKVYEVSFTGDDTRTALILSLP